MATDVESVLNEIRSRVVAESRSVARREVNATEPATTAEPLINHDYHAALDRLSAQLAVTARAWDRLPPVISNRGGSLNRLEVSIKKLFKPLTRWFTWEQINFNAAVHHALLETLNLLRDQEQELTALTAEAKARAETMDSVNRELQARIDSQTTELRTLQSDLAVRSRETQTQLAHVDSTLRQFSEMMHDLAEEMRRGHAELTNDMQRLFPEARRDLEAGLKKLSADFDVRLSEISQELREEQRVCFKQLSLEQSEAAILEDRGRRALELRLQKLEDTSNKTD